MVYFSLILDFEFNKTEKTAFSKNVEIPNFLKSNILKEMVLVFFRGQNFLKIFLDLLDITVEKGDITSHILDYPTWIVFAMCKYCLL